ncbi:MAG: glycosyltransferase [Bacteroidota bacterium]
MITGRDIIIFGDDWGRYPSTIQHIGSVLAQYNRIIWVGSLGLRKPEFSFRDVRRVVEKVIGVFSGKKNEHQELPVFQVNPFIIPMHNFSVARNFNSRSISRAITEKASQLGFTNPIIITSSPIVAQAVKSIPKSSLNYICLDDYSSFKGAFKCLIDLEKDLLQMADTCFAVSDDLVRIKVTGKGKSYFIPQGVDIDYFGSPGKVVKVNKRKVIGYFGLIADPWVDLELIALAARKCPEYDFVLIGKNEMDLSFISSIPNICYLGEVPYNKLMEHASNFDAGIIPFQLNNLTLASNPLKLREYLAMGIPVISTDLPEVRKFEEYVYVAADKQEFIHMIRTAIAEDNSGKVSARKEAVACLSWQSITGSVSDLIIQNESK